MLLLNSTTLSCPYWASSTRRPASFMMRLLARLRWKVITRGTRRPTAGGSRPVRAQRVRRERHKESVFVLVHMHRTLWLAGMLQRLRWWLPGATLTTGTEPTAGRRGEEQEDTDKGRHTQYLVVPSAIIKSSKRASQHSQNIERDSASEAGAAWHREHCTLYMCCRCCGQLPVTLVQQ